MIVYSSSLISNTGRIFVACSGGVDSIAAAHFLSRSNPKIELFHFNHKLRPQNDQMEEYVRWFGKDHGLQVVVKNAKEFAIKEDDGMEAGARAARIQAMLSLSPAKIVLAHHLNDAVESYLMESLTGRKREYIIPPKTTFAEGKDIAVIFRPFLKTRKRDFVLYCQRNNLEKYIVEDETNKDTNIKRNFIRNKVLPVVREGFPGIETVVFKKIVMDLESFNR